MAQWQSICLRNRRLWVRVPSGVVDITRFRVRIPGRVTSPVGPTVRRVTTDNYHHNFDEINCLSFIYASLRGSQPIRSQPHPTVNSEGPSNGTAQAYCWMRAGWGMRVMSHPVEINSTFFMNALVTTLPRNYHLRSYAFLIWGVVRENGDW